MDALQRKRLLADLALVFRYPYLVDQCGCKSNAEGLRGLGKWMRHDRPCKVCKRRIPPSREKCCSRKCAKRWQSRRKDSIRRKRGLALYPDFRNSVKTPIRIADLAVEKGLTEVRAQALAEALCARGAIKAWRGPRGGDIREIGVPIDKGSRLLAETR